MSEHHTQGRQGQGARHHRRYRSNRNYRHRMPRADEGSAKKKPSLLSRVLSFFGFGKKKDSLKPERSKKERAAKGSAQQPPQRVRVAQTRNAPRSNEGGSQGRGGRRRAASVPPTEQARLYVGNLSFEATEAELEELFKGFGHVRSVEIIYNTRTYRSKGYAFVEMEQLADAQRAAEVLHGQPFMGREMMVSAASERMERSERPAPAPREEKEAAPAPAPAAATAPKRESDDELTADFGEEIIVPLGQSAPVEEKKPAPAAPAAPAESPEPTPADKAAGEA